MTDTITSARAWVDQAAGSVHRLPSGNVARLRPVDVIDLMLEDGGVPDVLQDVAKSQEFSDLDPVEQLRMVAELTPFADRICKAAFVEPRIADNPDPDKGEIGLEHISKADKLYVFQQMFGGVSALARTFPDEPAGEVEFAPGSNELRAAAKRAGGAAS